MTVAQLKQALINADDEQDVVVRIPEQKGQSGIIKDVVDIRPTAVDSMFILNIDKLNKVQYERVLPTTSIYEED